MLNPDTLQKVEKPPRTRQRTPLSCVECRRRKQKVREVSGGDTKFFLKRMVFEVIPDRMRILTGFSAIKPETDHAATVLEDTPQWNASMTTQGQRASSPGSTLKN